ncbi:MAG: hypothetical protein CVV48_10615 [Spirochaetae bacterium HGW-Spirochaetae-4]|nr:MAG: hypothetical protein CVV48_10615 [Spirochaetae bacterium HGW-Spirochaetae-4]
MSEIEKERYWITDGRVYIGVPYGDARELTYEEYYSMYLQWLPQEIRRIRDMMIEDVEWRVRRYQDEQILGLPQTDDIIMLAQYIQALREVPQQQGFPDDVVWPILDEA